MSNSTAYWPFFRKSSPYFCVTTPAIFANYLKSKTNLDSEELMSFVEHMVLDEVLSDSDCFFCITLKCMDGL